MATNATSRPMELLGALNSDDWGTVLAAIEEAALCVQQAPPGSPAAAKLAKLLAGLSNHDKWEIRRSVAQIAARIPTTEFESALLRLATDDNARVRQAAQQSAFRRRDWRNASALGRQHEQRINATLDDIETRFGIRGREAVKRVSEHIANTFARELYHEVIKLISPLVIAADRLRTEVARGALDPTMLHREADRIGRQVTHLRSVLDAMRMYAAMPSLQFAPASLREIAEEAAQVARAWQPELSKPAIEIAVPPSCSADVARPRIVQALTNILLNAIESYYGLGDEREPIRVRAEEGDGLVTLSVEDSGCGMSAEVLRDAPILFSTNKPGGTGVGLPLAIKIIETEHSGRVTFESIKGHGTVVQVMIPSRHVAGT